MHDVADSSLDRSDSIATDEQTLETRRAIAAVTVAVAAMIAYAYVTGVKYTPHWLA